MADGDGLSGDERVRRSVARTLANGLFLLLLLGALGAWSWLGFYQLEPGQAAVVMRLGRFVGTVSDPGLHFRLPPPLESHEVVNVSEIVREEFGFGGAGEDAAGSQALLEAAMQTSDNNIVRVDFVVQYFVKDAFAARYRLADPIATFRDAAQAAVREVVARMTIDDVLSEGRGAIEGEAEELLQSVLDDYGAGLQVRGVQLQEVQPPPEVRAAFDDVINALQDKTRAVNQAQAHRNEILPRARAEAAELTERATGYREAGVAEATGAAERFKAVAVEYRKAPEVTRKRLYLETMESILPNVEKIIIEPGTAQVLPYLPLGRARAAEPR